jgi:hypothetical protein
MNPTRFDQSLQLLAGATGRRDAVRSLGAIGTALLAALGFAHVASADQRHTDGGHDHKHQGQDRHRNRNRNGDRQRNRGNAGPKGPDGTVQAARKRPAKRGPTGPTGPAGSTLATRRVSSPLSDPLPVTTGASVIAVANCGGEGKVVACGHSMSASPAQLVNAFVIAVVPSDDFSECVANLRRTTEAGSTAGAQIIAEAICLN